MLDLTIKNAKACTSSDIFVCDIGIKNEQIVLLEKNITQSSKKILDAKGRYVLPGGIDGHCHIDQPMKDGSVCADTFESGTKSAVFGGTTTVIPFAVQYKGDSLREVIKNYHTKANDNCYVDYAFHTIIADANKKVLNQELPAIIKDGYSHFKIYMTYDDLKLNDREILDVLSIANKEKAVVMIHAENHECISWLTEKLESEGKIHTKYHSNARPDIVEAEATNRAISLSRLTNTPILFPAWIYGTTVSASKVSKAFTSNFSPILATCSAIFSSKDIPSIVVALNSSIELTVNAKSAIL